MPAILDAPEHLDYVDTHAFDTDELTIERLEPRASRPRFWQTLAHRISTRVTHTPRAQHAPSCHPSRPFETPMDRCIREHPSLIPFALSMV